MEPREFTRDEVRTLLLEHIWGLIDDWDRNSRAATAREKLEGLAFSILAALDGSSVAIPSFVVAPCPGAGDRAYHASQGENWFPENHALVNQIKSDLGGSLHGFFYGRNPKRTSR
jgi:hypothetical protein